MIALFVAAIDTVGTAPTRRAIAAIADAPRRVMFGAAPGSMTRTRMVAWREGHAPSARRSDGEDGAPRSARASRASSRSGTSTRRTKRGWPPDHIGVLVPRFAAYPAAPGRRETATNGRGLP